jgi:hypothetical protein
MAQVFFINEDDQMDVLDDLLQAISEMTQVMEEVQLY